MSRLLGAQLVSSLRSCSTGYQAVDGKGVQVSFRVKGVYASIPDLIEGLRSEPRCLVSVHMTKREYDSNYMEQTVVARVSASSLAAALSPV